MTRRQPSVPAISYHSQQDHKSLIAPLSLDDCLIPSHLRLQSRSLGNLEIFEQGRLPVPKPLAEIRGFMFDLDGTTYLGDQLLPGALELYDLLHKQGKKVLYLTNNSSRSAAEYLEKLQRVGIPARLDEIFTSGIATVMYLQQQPDCRRIFPLATAGFERELLDGGFEFVSEPSERPDYVVLGFDTTLTYEKLRKACTMILNGAKFVASHPDPVCPTPGGPIPDCGAIAALISQATGATPDVLGKPTRLMLDVALGRLDCTHSEAAMVGDRLATDMRMGEGTELTRILVESPATADENSAPELAGVRPTHRFRTLNELIEHIRN